MELEPHSWSQGGIIGNNSDFDDDNGDSNNDESLSIESGSHSYSEDSLPRQSVVRRTSLDNHTPVTRPLTNNVQESNNESLEIESGSDYFEEQVSGPMTLRVSIPKVYSKGVLPSNQGTVMAGGVKETKLLCHSTNTFYQGTLGSKRSTTGRCFYKDQDDISEGGDYCPGTSRRVAARRAKFADFSDESEGESEEPSKAKRKRRTVVGRYDSDSDFVVSDDNYEEVSDSYGSESLTESSSSDEYTPYVRSTNKGGRKRNRKQGGSSEDDWGRMKRRPDHQTLSDASGSDSDYMPGSSFGRSKSGRGKRGSKKKKKRGNSDYEDDEQLDEDELEGFTRTTGRQREFISYKEDSEGNNDSDGGDSLVEGEKPVEEEDNREKIERILLSRIGRVGDTGKTGYSLLNLSSESAMDTSKNGNEADTEKQYLVKWSSWSHLHNTWETELTLLKAEVKGIQRLYNYMKKEEEKQKWQTEASPEELEYLKIQDELTEQLLEQYKEVERVIDARRTEEGCGQEYRCKWKGLPYSECTWEDGALIMDAYGDKIEMFERRKDSDCIPSQSAKVLKHRPKFSILKSQPMFLGGDRADQFQLRDYQLDGVNWLVHSWCKNNSVILADEMGLGKTIQSIAFLSCLFHVHALYGPFLLVVPLSTLPSWQREFELWAPEFNLIVYIGDVNSRTMIREHEWTYSNGKLKFNAVVTTYEILLKDKDFLGDVSWAVLVVDEAHRLKNDDSLLYRTLMTFHTNQRLLITGTPLQNSLKELWSLLHFIMKDRFSRWEDFEEAHSDYGSGDGSGLVSLHRELEPFLLRRIKKDVEKSLPAKVEQILRVEMSSVQKQYYRWIITKNYKALSKGVKGSIQGFINIVMELKKCCNHTYIVRQPDTPDVKDPLQSLLRGSGKLYLLDKLLVRLNATGHRVLIFSQMVRMLDILAEYMKYRRFQFQRLDGSINGQQRRDAIDHFNAEGSQDFCFLLSTRAGGLGVNLATADTVVIFDSDWNPQNDLQAQARAHRIGQTKQVNIYRLVTRNSVEEDIVERAKKKMVLDHLVIQKMDTTGRTILNKTRESSNNVPFNKNELDAILKFGTEELFKEGEKEEDKALKELDIDEILSRAETQEVGGEASVGDDLLSQFKMANFAIDENELGGASDNRRLSTSADVHSQSDSRDWTEIIPKSYLNKIEEEEKQAEQMQLYLPPRQRNVKTYNEDGTVVIKQSATGRKGGARSTTTAKEKAKRRDPSERKITNDVIVTKDLPGFEGNEIRRFVSCYRKFSAPYTRLDSIAALAELQEKSLSELQELATMLHDGCIEANEIYKQVNTSSEGETTSVGHPVLRLCGINIPSSSILEREKELEVLSKCIPSDPQVRRRFRLVTRAKPVSWPGVKWANVDDSRLLIGIYQHGLGNWENIKGDPEIGLKNKILPDNKQMKPQASHLKTRVDYLLKLLNSEKKASEKKTVSKTQRKTASKPVKDKVKNEKISKYFQPKQPKKKKPPSSEEESEEEQYNDEPLEDEDSDDDDSDDGEDWRTSNRSRKKPQTTTQSKRIPKRTKKGAGNGRGKPRSSQPNGKQSVRKRGGKDGGNKNSSGNSNIAMEGDIESDYELDDTVFQQCKAILKPVKKCLMHLPPVPDDNLLSSPSGSKTLLEIGDLITTSLSSYESDKATKQWRSHLWIFVAKFTAVSGRRLYDCYKTLKS